MEGFAETPTRRVPRVATKLSRRDLLGTSPRRGWVSPAAPAQVNPGLYCVGDARPESPVLVTANYKAGL